MLFQEIILTLQKFWAKHGCLIWQPYDLEKGRALLTPRPSSAASGLNRGPSRMSSRRAGLPTEDTERIRTGSSIITSTRL